MSIEEILNRTIEQPALRQPPKIGELQRVAYVPEVCATNEAKRTIEFVASTEKIDRYGDRILQSGWKTDAYMRNPVVLWAHDSRQPPIARTVSLTVESNPPALIQVVQFADATTFPFANQIFELYKQKFLRSVSVGFAPLVRPTPIRDKETDQITGFEFTSQELLELSCVPIPANADAVARAIAEGIVTRVDAPKFFREKEKIDDPVLALEIDLAQISLERLQLTCLEIRIKDLLRELRGEARSAPRESESNLAIKNLSQLEAALRGRAN